ncbi:MAG TPA: malto-oligosyltrehalose trehalohydrolase [Polyangia bacterium]|nr:malto-oligosyltrehalose trehalohydrolase [Polyangia bacterium]
MKLGATVEGHRTRFRVWAPRPRTIELLVVAPVEKRVALEPRSGGYFEACVEGVGAGARYFYLLDGERRRPDPASRAQPDGVHAASEVIDAAPFPWRHAPPARALAEQVIYELHVGTFTRAGTFAAAAAEFPRLAELGVTTVELMPVASFPGARNWGYDGVDWFAPQASYGGPDELRRLVDAAHGCGLAVLIDVVYNHFGPEGNYLGEFGPYFTARHATPWGDALDFAAQPVRAHVLENARLWAEEYRADGLRLDAVHAIFDDSPVPIVAAVARELHACTPPRVAIAESDLGDVRVIEPRGGDGWGCDAQWADDLHHALHAAVTGERAHYYADFGAVSDVARAVENGFVYTGQPSKFRGRPFGTPARHLPGERFVVCAQNHDQIGNRARGERLAALRPGAEHAVAAIYLLAPSVPMIFMGEEHADPAPFLYFTDHQDRALARAVSDGRRREFEWAGLRADEVPDPQEPSTFERSRIDLGLGERGRHAGVRRFYRALLALKRERASLRVLDRARVEARADDAAALLMMRRWSDGDETLVAANLGRAIARATAPAPRRQPWRLLLDGGAAEFGGARGVEISGGAAPELVLPPLGVAILGSG